MPQQLREVMPDHTERDGVTKLPKSKVADDFISWRRRVKAYLQLQEIDLIGLTNLPDPTLVTQHRRWLQANVKSKIAITLTLSDKPLAQMSTTKDDDDRTAKDLWTELENCIKFPIHKRSSTSNENWKTCNLTRTRSEKSTSAIFTDSYPSSHLISSPFRPKRRCQNCFGIFLKGLHLLP